MKKVYMSNDEFNRRFKEIKDNPFQKLLSNERHIFKQDQPIPSYYCVIPSYVRYCKELSPFEKLLYAEISALTNLYSYCYASNNYLAKLYGVSSSTISKAISSLVKNKFITTKNYVDPDTNFSHRLIFINEERLPKIKEHTPNFTNNEDLGEDLAELFRMAIYGK